MYNRFMIFSFSIVSLLACLLFSTILILGVLNDLVFQINFKQGIIVKKEMSDDRLFVNLSNDSTVYSIGPFSSDMLGNLDEKTPIGRKIRIGFTNRQIYSMQYNKEKLLSRYNLFESKKHNYIIFVFIAILTGWLFFRLRKVLQAL